MTKVLMVGSAEQSGGDKADEGHAILGKIPLWMAWYANSERIWREAVVCGEGLLQGAVYDMAV